MEGSYKNGLTVAMLKPGKYIDVTDKNNKSKWLVGIILDFNE